MRSSRLMIGVIVMSMAVVLLFSCWPYNARDDCLDAGGRWERKNLGNKGQCVGARTGQSRQPTY